MELFGNAKVVRLRSHHEKYLLAEEDQDMVSQDRNGSSKRAKWTVEFIPSSSSSPTQIRFKSCYNSYLTASSIPFLLGMTGKKVLQTRPRNLDSSVEWEPIREGFQVKLKTRYGNFLRANGGVPPWRNSVTHDVPHRSATQDWVLWDVDVVGICDHGVEESAMGSDSCSLSERPSHLEKLESSDLFIYSPPKDDGRTIYYHIADNYGDTDDSGEAVSFIFKGSGVEELTQKLEEEAGVEDIIVCTRSPLNGNLYPLRLHLPPNNAIMHVILVKSSSK
ncbi:hypothetical protein GIB67_004715, partial [Kingdonia uniflora]